MSEYRDLEFLAERSRELLDRQINSYRANHNKAGSIIGLSSVFIPIFIFIIEKSPKIIQLLSIVPILIFVYSIILMLNVLRSKLLDQGFNQDQLDKLVKQDYESILLYDIGAKKCSISSNQRITRIQNKRYNRGLLTTVIAIFFSISLLITNLIINNTQDNMTEKTEHPKTQTEPKPDVMKTTSRVIPEVPRSERMILNEGIEPKIMTISDRIKDKK